MQSIVCASGSKVRSVHTSLRKFRIDDIGDVEVLLDIRTTPKNCRSLRDGSAQAGAAHVPILEYKVVQLIAVLESTSPPMTSSIPESACTDPGLLQVCPLPRPKAADEFKLTSIMRDGTNGRTPERDRTGGKLERADGLNRSCVGFVELLSVFAGRQAAVLLAVHPDVVATRIAVMDNMRRRQRGFGRPTASALRAAQPAAT
jgi:hypothetical protein